MAVNFPDSPSTNDTYTVDGKTYKWTGSAWQTLPITDSLPSATSELTNDSNFITADVTGAFTVTNTSIDDTVLLTTTEDSSSAGPVLTFKRNSASPADADYMGQIKFKGENDADQEVVYAKITGKIQDATDGTEDGLIEFANKKAGSNVITARLRSDSLQLLNGTNLTVDGTVSATSYTGDGSNLTGVNSELVDDTTPQLGGDLDANGYCISLPDSSGADGDANLHFGASNDLQLYHNGTHSFIYDKGQGQLRVRSNYFHILNGSNSESLLEAKQGLGVHLYYSGNEKLVTTATGVEVTGDVVASGAVESTTGIFSNPSMINTNYTVPANTNAMSIGPLTVDATITITDGSSWTIV